MKLKKYTLIAALALPMAAAAQTASVTFDTDDYKAVSVYDSWENSPFRKGTLQGNVAVIDNHLNQVDDFLGEAPNSTAKILGVQRSRFGSNQFGARIDLKTPFSLSPTPQYVHVLINRPIEGRVMLMGLGKHREQDWAGQSPETEQFWEISTTTITPNKWTDAVFAIKGVSGVDIYSLVVVPECESPHERNQDFVAYIDQIVVNTSPAPLLQYDDYPTNFDKKSTKATRNDRGIKIVSLAGKTVNVSSDPSSGDPVYRDMMENTFPVKAGQEVTASMTIEGNWMNSYLYIDYGQDGKFSYDLNNDGTPAEGSDIKTFSNYNGKNSRGVTNSSNNTLAMPSFTIPEGTPKGFYRMRFKDDWSDIDPGGAPTIVSNGGGIVDVRLNVHEDNVTVTEDNRNGEVLSGDGSALMTTTPFGQAFTVKLNPENGFAYNGMRVRHGYNLDGDKLIRGTLQYVDDIVYSNAFDENDCYTIPAEWVDGDIVIEGLFVEKGTEISYDYLINVKKDTTISRTDRYLNAVTMAGKRVDIANDKKVYHEDISQTFFVAPGDEMTPTFGYAGGPMHGYVYIDKNQNGIFDTGNITNGVIGENSDAMTFSFWSGNNTNGQSGYNSNGVNLTGSARNVLNPPSFIIPNLADGFYRIRFKVDWNEIDAGGNVTSNNHIISNGGGIADYRLRVFSGSEVNVSVVSGYGEVLNVSNQTLDGTTVPYNEALTLKVVPNTGYEVEEILVTHGVLDANPAIIHSVPQVLTTTYTGADLTDGELTLPAEIVDGDLKITVRMVDEPSDPSIGGDDNNNTIGVTPEYPAATKPGTASLTVSGTDQWTLGNNLFSATFAKRNGVLSFVGAEALDIQGAKELFEFQLYNGTKVKASAMTLQSVTMETLTPNNAVRTASESRANGYALKAVYTYNFETGKTLTATWRAVLRDGSHYLRTTVDFSTTHDVKMKTITPMQFYVNNRHGVPTRNGQPVAGSPLVTSHIFAGLETPTALNTVVGAADFEVGSWKNTYFNDLDSDEVPAELLSLTPYENLSSFSSTSFSAAEGPVTVSNLTNNGTVSFTFLYGSGSCGLATVGVQLLDANGSVVAHDYHTGFSGSRKVNHVYTLTGVTEGNYTLRYIIDHESQSSICDAGTITVSGATIKKGTNSFEVDSWKNSYFSNLASSEVPSELLSLTPYENITSFSSTSFSAAEGPVTVSDLTNNGTVSFTFLYGSGSCGLATVGVQLLNANGSVVAHDYHTGFSGGRKVNHVYTLTGVEAGNYTLRYIIDHESQSSICDAGTITVSEATITKRDDAVATPTSTIQGVWRRPQWLKPNDDWHVGAVVGLIAQDDNQDQARRSVLAYVERERAVPWRSFSLYNSWYELNINRTNKYSDYSHCMTEAQCMKILQHWKDSLYTKRGQSIQSFVWDDGWDTYGNWGFNPGFPNGFTNISNLAGSFNTNIGAWLGPKGGYDTAGAQRKKYWTDKDKTMGLAEPEYYSLFLDTCSHFLQNYNFNCFKFDGIREIGVNREGPATTEAGLEDCEGIIGIEAKLRKVNPDVFIYTTVGTWASPFWFKYTDAIWKQGNDWETVSGAAGDLREKWITYRDSMVHDIFVTNSPLTPINNLMTHGVIVSKFGDLNSSSGAASMPLDYDGIVRELRCAYGSGSAMVELYMDTLQLDNINNGKLWDDVAECIEWHKKNADVLGDTHWVGGAPWDGSTSHMYGWAAWNERKNTVTLRNPCGTEQTLTTTLRKIFEIPSYITDRYIALTDVYANQTPTVLSNAVLDIDKTINITLPPFMVVAYDGVPSATSVVTPYYEMEQTAATALEDTLYVLNAISNKGEGYIYYDSSASNRKYRANTSGIDFSDKVTDLNYVWRLKKSNDGTTFTLQNLANPSVYFVADASRNTNFSGTETANLVWNSDKTMNQTNYTNGSNTMYIHANQAANTLPNLSYWDNNGAIGTAGTCVVFDFYRVTYVQPSEVSPTYTVTYNYMLDGQVKLTTQADVRRGRLLPAINVPDYVVATTPEGVVNNDTTVNIPCTLSLPFEISNDLQKHYYFLKLGTGGTYDPIRYVDDGDASKTVLQTNITEVDKGCVWYFKGDPFSGISIYNAQEDKILITSTTMSGSNGGGTYPHLADANAALGSGYTNLWNISPTAVSGVSDGFNLKIYGGTNEYINYRDGNLAFWNNSGATNAGGSVLRVIKDVPVISLNDGGDGYYYATTYLPFDTDVPANSEVGVYAAALNSRGTGVDLSDPLTAIPANSGVILKSASASTLTLTLCDETLAALSGNVLQGSCEAIVLTDANRANYLIFGRSTTDGKPGFYKPSSAVTSIRANRAHIPATSLPASASAGLAFDDLSITGLNGIETSGSTKNAFYDLQGRRVIHPQKGGVYIRNGKKVIW